MLAYGIPRHSDLDGGLDCADAGYYAVKSSRCHRPGRGGDIKSSIRGPKAVARRPFKKLARARAKHELFNFLKEMDD